MTHDKVLHFIGGFFLGFPGSAISPLAGIILAIAVGAGKEIYDYYGHGTPEWLDFVATVAGGLVGMTLGMVL